MESKARLFGHAIHPILIVYPLGLLSTAVVFDIIYLVTGNPTWTTVSFWMIAAGIIGGLLAAVFGLIDYLNIPAKTRASRIGLLHGLTNLFVMILFIASWVLRRNSPDVPSTAAFALSFIGVAAALLKEQLPADLVVVLLLRADVEHHVGHRQELHQLLAVGQVVAVEVRGVDQDFLLQSRPVVHGQPAVA